MYNSTTMELAFQGALISVIGKIMVILAVLHMHSTLVAEHKIDRKVILSFRQERLLTWCGLLFIVVGFALTTLF